MSPIVDSAVTVWIDGAVRQSPSVSPLDHGFLVGDGVFETLKTVHGAPFALSRHLRRLACSAAGMGLSLPSEAALRSAVAETPGVVHRPARPVAHHRHQRGRATGLGAGRRAGDARRDPRSDRAVATVRPPGDRAVAS